jgi:hypothetical protein
MGFDGRLCIVIGSMAAYAAGCGGSGGSSPNAVDGGAVDGGAGDVANTPPTDAAAPLDAASNEVDGGGSSGFDAGPACQRDAPYDMTCTARGEPGAAYICYDPGGGHIPAACAINPGALIVCCPTS